MEIVNKEVTVDQLRQHFNQLVIDRLSNNGKPSGIVHNIANSMVGLVERDAMSNLEKYKQESVYGIYKELLSNASRKFNVSKEQFVNLLKGSNSELNNFKEAWSKVIGEEKAQAYHILNDNLKQSPQFQALRELAGLNNDQMNMLIESEFKDKKVVQEAGKSAYVVEGISEKKFKNFGQLLSDGLAKVAFRIHDFHSSGNPHDNIEKSRKELAESMKKFEQESDKASVLMSIMGFTEQEANAIHKTVKNAKVSEQAASIISSLDKQLTERAKDYDQSTVVRSEDKTKEQEKVHSSENKL